jgi:amidase
LAEEALAAADAADAGASRGPLHGVPFTVKENIDVAGTPTTLGVAALAEAVAPIDAPQVERLRAAGAIPIGRTNLPDLRLRVHTDSSLRELTRNPWDVGVTAGGSSGGEGSALASGMSPLGLGNDVGARCAIPRTAAPSRRSSRLRDAFLTRR